MWEAIHHRLAPGRYDFVHFFGGVQVYEFRNLVARSLPTVIAPYDSYSLFLERAMAAARRPVDRVQRRAELWMARRYERTMYRGFGRVVVVTENDAACLRRLVPDLPTVVIPNGVDDSFYRPVENADRPPRLVFVGNMTYPPNVAAAVMLITEILPRVAAQISGVSVTIVGPHPPTQLTALRREQVEITGWVPDVRPQLARSACFVSPLTQGTGIRNKILEAMASGLPVAATPLSCEGIQVRDGEDVLLGRDPDELAAAAIRLLRDESLRRRIAEGGQRLVRRDHTWSQAADRYEALYDAVGSEWQLSQGAPR
jgi:glycosyltransferase involved in cell wall biosynthesis